MPSATEIVITIFNIIQTGAGLTLNTCIAYFSFKGLQGQPSANSTMVIYFTMGLVNVFMQLVNTVQNFIFSFWSHLLLIREINVIFNFLMFSFFYCNYWLTGWLCAYYCININNFTHQLLIWFKRVLTTFLLWILLVSSIGSVALSLSSIWMVNVVFLMQTTNNTRDSSTYTVNLDMSVEYRMIATFLGCFLPFGLALISTGVTTLSLIRHMRKMKENISEHSSSNHRGLASATRTMALFLVLCIIFHIAELIFFSSPRRSSSDLVTVTAWIIITFFPSAEGAIIIQGTPKLRKMILEMFCAKRQISNVID